MTPRAIRRGLGRLAPAVGGAVVFMIGLIGLLGGRILISVLTMLIGCSGIVGVVYHDRVSQKSADLAPGRRMLLTMALTWLGVGVVTLIVGIAAGGVLLAICILGFVLSMYLCVGLSIAAIRVR